MSAYELWLLWAFMLCFYAFRQGHECLLTGGAVGQCIWECLSVCVCVCVRGRVCVCVFVSEFFVTKFRSWNSKSAYNSNGENV